MKNRSSQKPITPKPPIPGGQGAGPGTVDRSKGSPSVAAKWSAFKSRLGRPVHGASLAVFRIAVGVVMALEAFSLLRPSASNNGQVMLETFYTSPDLKFHFPYAWFEWLPFLPANMMYVLVGLLALGGVLMALGLFYRISAVLVFLTWGYLYAVESTRTYWMSYYYLELLVTFLLIWMSAARMYSIDAFRARKRNPVRTVPYWTLLLLRWQLVITYFYAGFAKINADWLLDAVPMRDFLAHPSVPKRIEGYLGSGSAESVFKLLHSEWLPYFLSYSGMAFDLSIGFLLLIRRTHLFGLVLLVLFHAINHFILFEDIIWFPLLGIATATIFLNPNWPEVLGRSLRSTRGGPAVKMNQNSLCSSVPSYTALFVCAWLGIQAVLPLRRYLIAGDARFTWEGLSFSWRLKTEKYQSSPCDIVVHDPGIVALDASGKTRIDWTKWPEHKVIYRYINSRRPDWARLPEIFVLFEPELGERIFFNPLANSQTNTTETAIRAHVTQIWRQLYGHAPKLVRPTVPLIEIIDGYAAALKSAGRPVPKNRNETLDLMLGLNGRKGDSQMIPFLRRIHPFALQEEIPVPMPFFVIEDPSLMRPVTNLGLQVDRSAWQNSDATHAPQEHRYVQVSGDALVVYTAELDLQTRQIFPQCFVYDSEDHPDEPPAISWDYLKDLNLSEGMHISTQPFLLRRYARRVAGIWEKKYGRRPSVTATTAVSLNDRPLQPLVDPKADLASVPVSQFRHNNWITDLELRRIPRANLTASTAQ